MSKERKILGRPSWMRELRASFGLHPDGAQTILKRLLSGPPETVEVIDVSGDPLAEQVAAASRAATTATGGSA
jgi:hypothetical protein